MFYIIYLLYNIWVSYVFRILIFFFLYIVHIKNVCIQFNSNLFGYYNISLFIKLQCLRETWQKQTPSTECGKRLSRMFASAVFARRHFVISRPTSMSRRCECVRKHRTNLLFYWRMRVRRRNSERAYFDEYTSFSVCLKRKTNSKHHQNII